MSSNPAGSTWKKWDLHVHTPCSLVQNYGGDTEDTWEAFLGDLEQLPSDFKVLGINDYIFIEGYERVRKAKREHGRLRNIDLILPVVEFRLDKFAGVVKKDNDGKYSRSDWNRVNLHVIFDELEPDLIRQQFLNALAPSYSLIPDATHLNGKWQAVITPESLKELGQMIIGAAPVDKRAAYGSPLQEGFNNLCVSLESIKNALAKHPLANRYLLAVGKTEWDNMKWDDQSIAEKRNVINGVELVFTASPSPEAYGNARKRLTEAKVNDRLLDCSDAHALSTSEDKDRIGNCFTWIKADSTFEGLRHAVTEFDERVFVGDLPPKRLMVTGTRTKYASAVTIKKKAGSPLIEEWFHVDLPLNHDLVAIIGNKGSGKSALADVAALAGSTRNYEKFSFLTEDRFRDPKAKLAGHFIGTLRWEDGKESSRELHLNPSSSDVERVKYLPQSYLEALCNELVGGGSSTFDRELRKIIYTHVPEDERLGFHSLDELLNFKVAEIETEREQVMQQLSKHNEEIIAIEKKLAPEFFERLRAQLEAKEGELQSLEDAKPAEVADPSASDAARSEAALAGAKLQGLEGELASIRAQENAARDKKASATKRGALVNRAVQTLRNYERAHQQFLDDLGGALNDIGGDLAAGDLVSLTIKTTKLETIGAELKAEAEAQDRRLNSQDETGIIHRRFAVEAEITGIKGTLDEKQRLFVVYREQLAQWERARAELIGTSDKVDSIEWFKAQTQELERLPDRLSQLRKTREATVRRLHEQIEKNVAEYERLYLPVQDFVKSAAIMDMPLPLAFNVRIAEEGFQDNFINRINRQTRGSFSGIDESNQVLHNVLRETDFGDPDATIEFVKRIDDMLHFDRRDIGNGTQMQPADQLRKGNELKDVYDFIHGLSYLQPRYSLTYGEQEIARLSPGERGLLLLVFYLLVDKDDIPLVIDQPEENLDNQTIFKILVTCIKAAKRRRQVIMVTHNPNLAVVCDAEQIICASCDKANSVFNYVSGAIESPGIKAKVVEILEGTEPAFVNRKRKYGL
ncbi:MAG TPA: AAA family ATPase [Terriglobia bacterium]|nr:AAA family ATPase [Terriglobia bacterium]